MSYFEIGITLHPLTVTDPKITPPSSPAVVSLRTISVEDGATFEWHSHPFAEFTLVTDDRCVIGYPPGWRETAPDTLFFYHAGEKHGAFTAPRQRPRFWVVHLVAGAALCRDLPQLSVNASEKRVWTLRPEQSGVFQWIFLQLLNEHSGQRPYHGHATSAWLQLLLVNVQRWAARTSESVVATPARAGPEVLRLWHLLNAAVGKSNDELKELYTAPGYDSVRHAFRRTFGCSPREMLQRLRVEHAKNLLLESTLSIKEISLRVGCVQQHHFNRLFHRYVGMAPSRWRSKPWARRPET